jgi:GT2 family glycosyltransferase
LEIVVVDDDSGPQHCERLQAVLPSGIRVYWAKQRGGYARSINLGAAFPGFEEIEFLLAMNNDILLPDTEMVAKLARALHGDSRRVAASPMIRDSRSKTELSNSGQVCRVPSFTDLLVTRSSLLARLPLFKAIVDRNSYADIKPYKPNAVIDCETINGATFLIKADFLREIGYLDEHTFLYIEELTLGARIKNRNATACLVTSTVVDHLQGCSTGATPVAFRPKMFIIHTRSELHYVRRYLNAGLFLQALFVVVRFHDGVGKAVVHLVRQIARTCRDGFQARQK